MAQSRCLRLEDHEIEIAQRNDGGDDAPNRPAPAEPPIAVRNLAARRKRARLRSKESQGAPGFMPKAPCQWRGRPNKDRRHRPHSLSADAQTAKPPASRWPTRPRKTA